MTTIIVAALYRFAEFPDPAALRGPLAKTCCANGVTGTLILAREGVNGTIAGSRAGVDAALAHLRGLPGCAELEARESIAETPPFRRMKVRLKPEIVTLGRTGVDPRARVGTYVAPRDWNALISAPEVAVIDARNVYETALGSFAGAIAPGTARFRDFPAWWRANAARLRDRPVAMFCTGGIRCEKASSFLLSEGVAEVFHLRGGILAYLETTPERESLWRGQCYVFDRRVSVGHGLAPGGLGTCHGCGAPVSEADRADPAFERGVACLACVGAYDDARRARFRERQRQIDLAAARAQRSPAA